MEKSNISVQKLFRNTVYPAAVIVIHNEIVMISIIIVECVVTKTAPSNGTVYRMQCCCVENH